MSLEPSQLRPVDHSQPSSWSLAEKILPTFVSNLLFGDPSSRLDPITRNVKLIQRAPVVVDSFKEDVPKTEPHPLTFPSLDSPILKDSAETLVEGLSALLAVLLSTKPWVKESLQEMTTATVRNEADQLMKSLFDEVKVDEDNSPKVRALIKPLYSSLSTYLTSSDLDGLINTSTLSILDKQKIILFIQNLKKPDSLSEEAVFSSFFEVPPLSRLKFHEILKSAIVEKIGAKNRLVPAIGKIAQALSKQLIAKSQVSPQEPTPKREAVGRVEKSLYSLLDDLEDDPNFIAARASFAALKSERGITSFPLTKLMLSEGVKNPVAAFLLKYLEEHGDDEAVREFKESLQDGETTGNKALLLKILTSERYFPLLLGETKRSSFAGEQDRQEMLIKQVLSGVVELLFKQLEKVGKERGVQRILDHALIGVDQHITLLNHAEYAKHWGEKTVLKEFQDAAYDGCHPIIKGLNFEGFEEEKFRKKLEEHVGKLLDQLVSSIPPEELETLFKNIYRNREELIRLAAGIEGGYLNEVLNATFVDENNFTEIAKLSLAHLLDKNRGVIVKELSTLLLDFSKPAKLQSLVIKSVLPSALKTIRKTALTSFYLHQLANEPPPFPLSERLMSYYQSSGMERTFISQEITKDLQNMATLCRARGLKISDENVYEAQTELVKNLMALPQTDELITFRSLVISSKDQKQFFLDILLNEHQKQKKQGGFLSDEHFIMTERAALNEQGIHLYDQEVEEAKKAFLEEISGEKNSDVPKHLKSYGHLVNQLIFGSSIQSEWVMWASSFWQGYLTKEVVDLLRPIRESTNPFVEILPLLQPVLVEQLSTENLMKSFNEPSSDIQDETKREAALKEATLEIAIFAKMLIDQKAPASIRRFLPSERYINDLLATRVVALTSRGSANANLLLLLIDAVAKEEGETSKSLNKQA